jgi:hypothetical protein
LENGGVDLDARVGRHYDSGLHTLKLRGVGQPTLCA